MLSNPWVISIVGGVIASIIGGVILGAIGRLDGGQVSPTPLVVLGRLALFSFASAVMIGVIFGPLIPAGALNIGGMEGLDPILRVLGLIFGEVGLFLGIFFGIEIVKM